MVGRHIMASSFSDRGVGWWGAEREPRESPWAHPRPQGLSWSDTECLLPSERAASSAVAAHVRQAMQWRTACFERPHNNLVGSHAGDPSVEFWRSSTLRNRIWLRQVMVRQTPSGRVGPHELKFAQTAKSLGLCSSPKDSAR